MNLPKIPVKINSAKNLSLNICKCGPTVAGYKKGDPKGSPFFIGLRSDLRDRNAGQSCERRLHHHRIGG